MLTKKSIIFGLEPPLFMEQDDISLQVKTLPSSPGVYQYFDDKGTIIYVGKAKNLKKRVRS